MSNRKDSKKMSRREFAREAAATAAAIAAPAVLAAGVPANAEADGASPDSRQGKPPQKSAAPVAPRSPRRRSIEIVEKFPVPMATEPDFIYRP